MLEMFYTALPTLITTWLLSPWNVPAAAAAKLLQSCPTLCDPIDGSPPGSAIPGILQARTLEWVAISFSNAWSEKWKWSRSVVSDSSWPHGLQPTRLLHPWDFPGKSTGSGCHWNVPSGTELFILFSLDFETIISEDCCKKQERDTFYTKVTLMT